LVTVPTIIVTQKRAGTTGCRCWSWSSSHRWRPPWRKNAGAASGGTIYLQQSAVGEELYF